MEGWCFAHGGESPSTLVPCLVANAPPFASNPPHPSPIPSTHIILYYKADINNHGLLCPAQLFLDITLCKKHFLKDITSFLKNLPQHSGFYNYHCARTLPSCLSTLFLMDVFLHNYRYTYQLQTSRYNEKTLGRTVSEIEINQLLTIITRIEGKSNQSVNPKIAGCVQYVPNIFAWAHLFSDSKRLTSALLWDNCSY